jgi:hypothetical protein
MDWFWNWGDECFGYRDGDSEVMSDNPLITSRSKKSWVRGSFGPRTSVSSCVQLVYKKAVLKGLKLDLSNAESSTDS